MRFEVITLFPELVQQVLQHGVLSRAADQGLLELQCWNPRDFTHDRHRQVDDRPYGGGPGMLMMVQPLRDAIAAARQSSPNAKLVYLSPQGQRFDQPLANRTAQESSLILLCGRYEGIDQRIIELDVDEQWSLGDFVLSGGELAAMSIIDAVARQIPGVLGHEQSAEQDSFMQGLLDCPHYTRPELIDGLPVPAVLLSGHHQQIERWRLQQALGTTWQHRPDLLEQLQLSTEQQKLLQEFIHDNERRESLKKDE